MLLLLRLPYIDPTELQDEYIDPRVPNYPKKKDQVGIVRRSTLDFSTGDVFRNGFRMGHQLYCGELSRVVR